MLNFFINKGFVNASKLTNYFASSFSYSLFFILFYFLISFLINDNLIYCMDDNSSSGDTPTIGITINSDNAFKYLGIGGLASGLGLGAAKILKTVPAHSRVKLITMLSGLTGAVYTTTSISSDLASNRVTRSMAKKIEVPDVEFDGVIKFGDYSIKTKINNNELTLSELSKITSSNKSTEKTVENLNVSSSTDDYYTITDSYNIKSILESGDLMNILHTNPYLKLEFVLLFVLGICLSSLFSLTVVTILNKYGDKLNSYFTNKYILMYINLNKKYLSLLIWIWLAILYIIIILAMVITYLLIYYYEDYFIQDTTIIANSFMIFSYCNSRNIYDKNNDENNDDDDDEEGIKYFEDGSYSISGSKYINFRLFGDYKMMPSILDSNFMDELRKFINSIKFKENFSYYIEILTPVHVDIHENGNFTIGPRKLNVFSILLRNKNDLDINFDHIYHKIYNLIENYVDEFDNDELNKVYYDSFLYIRCEEINLSNQNEVWKLKALDLSNLYSDNIKRGNIKKGFTADNASEMGRLKNNEFNTPLNTKVKNNKRSYSTFSKNINITAFDQRSPMFISINKILKSDLSYKDKQIKIEETLLYFWKEEFERMLKTSKVMNSGYSLNLLIREYKSLEKDFSFFLKDKTNLRHKKYLNIISNIEFSLIISNILNKLIPFIFKYNKIEEQKATVLYRDIGNSLFNEHVTSLYRNSKLLNDNLLSFKEFKDNIRKEYSDDDLEFLGLSLISIMEINSSLFTTKEMKIKSEENFKTIKYFIPTEILLNIINEIIFTGTEEIPLIAAPIPWEIKDNKITKYGGYYLNDESLFSPLVRLSYENSMSDTGLNKEIIDSINYMSSIPYSINRDVLEILLNDLEILKSISSLHEDTPKIKEYLEKPSAKDFEKINEITEHNSKYYYINSIINVAKLMSNEERFYYSFFLDWRGRIYTKSGALNFQSGDLAKSLLKFSNGCILNEQGVFSLKIYLANLYGKDKLSHDKRIEWVTENEGLIIDIESGFWKNADEPYTFLAASIEYKNYLKDPFNFISHLPILLDATCNGLQHLAAMSKDITLAKKVNLLESNSKSDPEDCYSLMIQPIKDEINKLIESEPIYSNLGMLELKRILIKRPIMTISYGISIKGIQEQIIDDHFIRMNYKINDKIVYKSKEYLGDVILNNKEIYKLSEIIYTSLFKEHPMLSELVSYFKEIVKLINNLSLPLVWITPTGLEINQSYSEFENVKLTTKIYGKRKSLVVRKKLQQINKRKQISAFVPNFIHSMDASNVCLLTKSIVELKQNINILTIHDCFGTLANDAPNVAYLVKNAFIQIYAKSDFLKDFHNFILDYLVKNNCKINSDKSIVNFQGKKYPIPVLPKLGKLNLKEQIPNSLYFIN